MKLSAKVSVLFVGMTIVTIIFFLTSSRIMTSYLYEGEMSRITGVTSGATSRFEGKMQMTLGQGYSYKQTLMGINRVYESQGIDVLDQLGLVKSFEKDEYDYNVILDENLEALILRNNDEKPMNPEHMRLIEQDFKNYTKREEPTVGVLVYDNTGYLINIQPLVGKKESKVKYHYFVGIDQLGEEYIAAAKGDNVIRDMVFENKLSQKTGMQVAKVSPKKQLLIHYGEDYVEAYFEVPRILNAGELYLKVTEPLVVKKSVNANNMMILGLLIILLTFTNILIWLAVNKIVIKPIKKMNKEINEIDISSSGRSRIDGVEGADELGKLTGDINRMLQYLEEANDAIRDKDKKYYEILNRMTNAFAMCKVKYDENGKMNEIICLESNAEMKKIFNHEHIGEKVCSIKRGDLDIVNFDELQWILQTVRISKEPYVLEQVRLTNDMWGQGCIYLIEEDIYYIVLSDITKLKQYSEQMQYMANYDALTGLKNRYSLYSHLELLIEKKTPFAIYFIDLDNFKKINDTIGHNEGDRLLCLVADRLKTLANDTTFVSRVGGDEFFIVCSDVVNGQQVKWFANYFTKYIEEYLRESEQFRFDISLSIGVSLYPQHGETAENLIKYADIAMYRSKCVEGNHFEVFQEEMLENIQIESALKKGLENEEFLAYYQPLYDLQNKCIIGAEALVRWNHEGQIISPFKFIDVAKQTGDIVAIDLLILQKACMFCKTWHDKGYKNFNVAVNMSAKTLNHPELLQCIQESLSAAHLPATALKIEITEDEIIDRPQQMVQLLEQLRNKGIEVSLDDFGIGYSSFNHIKTLPIDILKIDKSLITKIEKDEKTSAIIKTLIDLAHQLDLEVIAEGIELNSQLDKLTQLRCDYIQGYYISQPVEEKIFETCMEHYNGETVYKEVK